MNTPVSPFDRIAAQYEKYPREEPFLNYLLWFHRHGFVFSRPDIFVMGKPVRRDAPKEAVLDPTHLFKSDDCDAWYIFAAAGNMARLWSILPWPMGWICWTRIHDPLSELVFVPTETLKRLCPPELTDEALRNIPTVPT